MGSLAPFNSMPPPLEDMWRLLNWSLVVGAVIFALVTGLVLYVAIRYRHRTGQPEPRQHFGHTRLEIGWTSAFALVLVVFFIITLIMMRTHGPPEQLTRSQAPDIVIVGYQWWWSIAYPKDGFVTANEVHIPVGQRFLVRLEAADVIHNFWVPELAPKHDMIPGYPNDIWLEAEEPGVYWALCNEYCGVQHAKMQLYVIADTPEDYERWRTAQQQSPPTPTESLAVRGAGLFNQLTCVNCHAISNQGGADAGPSLAHLASRRTIGAGILPNTPENLAFWTADPHKAKPGVYMPGYAWSLSDEEMAALVAYLETLE